MPKQAHPLTSSGPAPRRIDYQRELNPAQYQAVTATEGPVLVIAGAGSGKTRTLVYRLAYLVDQGVDPEHILLLTFTRKASREMLNRAADLLQRPLTAGHGRHLPLHLLPLAAAATASFWAFRRASRSWTGTTRGACWPTARKNWA
jgi:superfamily I DNA/RNA helicase